MSLARVLGRSLPRLPLQWLPLTHNASLPHLFSSSAEESPSLPVIGNRHLTEVQRGVGVANECWMWRSQTRSSFPFGGVAYSHRRITTTPDGIEGPVAIDYSALLPENKFNELSEATLEDLQDKIEAWGEDLDLDGFDSEYSQGVLTVKFGPHGTYVLNKQTPNRQIWLSSPVSGPARFDWDKEHKHWVYRRTKAELLSLLESELQALLGVAIDLH